MPDHYDSRFGKELPAAPLLALRLFFGKGILKNA
jgi:hypothetical protein